MLLCFPILVDKSEVLLNYALEPSTSLTASVAVSMKDPQLHIPLVKAAVFPGNQTILLRLCLLEVILDFLQWLAFFAGFRCDSTIASLVVFIRFVAFWNVVFIIIVFLAVVTIFYSII